MIELRLSLPIESEKKIRRYVRKEFKTTLEKQFQNVLIEWIGKAVEQIVEHKRNSKDEL